MNIFGLPEDCFEFLSEGKQLSFDVKECEAGPVQLRSTDELKLERLPVETYPNTFREEDPLLNAEGSYDEPGFYYVLAVPLTQGDRVSYSILLWLPLEKVFATYDDDHHDLLLFHNTTWSQIVANPLKYLNTLWEVDFEERNSDFVQELKPWIDHPFRPGLTLEAVERNSTAVPNGDVLDSSVGSAGLAPSSNLNSGSEKACPWVA